MPLSGGGRIIFRSNSLNRVSEVVKQLWQLVSQRQKLFFDPNKPINQIAFVSISASDQYVLGLTGFLGLLTGLFENIDPVNLPLYQRLMFAICCIF